MNNWTSTAVLIALLTVPHLQSPAAPPDVDGDGIVGPEEAIDLAESWKGPALPTGGVQPWQIDGATIFYNTGKVGIGSATPHHQLRISGGPLWTSNAWTGSLELDNAAAIGWRANEAGKRFGIGQTGGGLYFFHTESDPGTATSEAHYAMTITDTGAVGVGTTAPNTKFQVNDGRIRLGNSLNSNRWDLFQHDSGNLFYIEQNAAYRNFMIVGGPDGRVGIGTDTPAGGTKLNVVLNAPGFAIRGDGPNGSGVVGTSAAGGNAATAGLHSGLNGIGLYGEANGSQAYGVYGKTNIGSGVYGIGDTGYGVYGTSPGGIGVAGKSASNIGVEGTSTDYWGVSGVSTNSIGVSGASGQGTGVDGYSGSGSGVKGVGTIGIEAEGNGAGTDTIGMNASVMGNGYAAVRGYAPADSPAWAGIFNGDVMVIGDLEKSSGSVLIDHPSDPANKYLSHSSVESSEMKNVYDGLVVTDGEGYGEVLLPDWFESLNKDFRYQLTVVENVDSEDFVQAKIAKKVEKNRFTIRTSRANTEVSWQVTGIRNDPYAKAHPLEVETSKKPKDRDKYLTPELYGQPKEKGIHYRPQLTQETVKVPVTAKQEEMK